MDAHFRRRLELTLGASLITRAWITAQWPVGRLESRHHGIADGLHDGAPFTR